MPADVPRERRRFRRVCVELPFEFESVGFSGDPGRSVQALTTSLSCGGVSFRSPVSLPIHAHLQAKISLPSPPIEIRARGALVRIIGPEQPGEGFEYAIEFDRVDAADALAQFVMAIDVAPLLQKAIELDATVLHLCGGAPPMGRVRRELFPIGETPLDGLQLEAMLLGILNERQRKDLSRARSLDLPFAVPELGAWRAHVHYQRGQIEAAFRRIEQYVPAIEELGLPPGVRNLARCANGLVLVTGPARSGKSTTLAAMIGVVNDEFRKIIVTLEDPILIAHQTRRSVIKQRELGVDAPSFLEGMRQAFRQDPDVIALDGLNEPGALELVVHASEMNCLMLVTMPVSNAVEALHRLVLTYPREQRAVALHILASGIRGIITQRLVPTRDGAGHALASEALIPNDAIRHALRAGQLDHIPNLFAAIPGAYTLEHSLRNLCQRGEIEMETALRVANDPDLLRRLFSEHRT